jgi:hypothetical protein
MSSDCRAKRASATRAVRASMPSCICATSEMRRGPAPARGAGGAGAPWVNAAFLPGFTDQELVRVPRGSSGRERQLEINRLLKRRACHIPSPRTVRESRKRMGEFPDCMLEPAIAHAAAISMRENRAPAPATSAYHAGGSWGARNLQPFRLSSTSSRSACSSLWSRHRP